MKFQPLSPNFKLPTRGSKDSGGLDIYMPADGDCSGTVTKVPLGFAAAVPYGHIGLLVPRSSVGAKYGLELNNTCGIIDADYRNEWYAFLRTKNGDRFTWKEGERILQLLLVPVRFATPIIVDSLDDTERTGGFGSTGT